MKKLISLTSICLVYFNMGCQMKPKFHEMTLSENEKNEIKCDLVIATKLDKELLPIDNIDTLNLEETNDFIVHGKIFNSKQKEYHVVVTLFDESNQIVGQNGWRYASKTLNWNPYVEFSYENLVGKPNSLKIVMELNKHKVGEKKITIKKTN